MNLRQAASMASFFAGGIVKRVVTDRLVVESLLPVRLRMMVPSRQRGAAWVLGLGIAAAAILPTTAFAQKPTAPPEIKIECPAQSASPPEIARSAVYADTPFKSGERAVYEVSYMGMKAGYATMTVKAPMRHNGIWHRIYHAEAKTGDWFRTIFVGHNKVEAYARPWDFGVSKFYLEQFEQPVFRRPYIARKWLDFDHGRCKVKERTVRPEKPEKNEEFDFAPGAMDALSIAYWLRTRTWEVGKMQRGLVYTSEKNWWLEASPTAIERIKVGAGEFQAVKMKLQTFIGKELQQRGDVNVWVATEHPARPIVQIQGEIKIGSIWIGLHQLTPGT